MNIQFYYIPGISTSSEPYFSDLTDMENKLSAYRVGSSSNSFYPPLYNNKIKITKSMISNNQYNYISLNYNNKEWYYFVDNFEYLNDEIYYINCTLDTINTFRFDIYFKRFEKSRSFSFEKLRDNISRDDTFYLDGIYKPYISYPYLCIIRFKDRLGDSVAHYLGSKNMDALPLTEFSYLESNNYHSYYDGLKTIILPINKTNSTGTIYTRVKGHYNQSSQLSDVTTLPIATVTMSDSEFLINLLENDPNVFNIYITKIYPDGISYNVSTNTITLSDDYSLDGNHAILCCRYDDFKSNIKLVNTTYNTITMPNATLKDSNYLKIFMGEYNDLFQIPIEYVESYKSSLNIRCMLDVASGNRIYTTDSQELNNMGIFHICTSIENIPLYNDNYNIYLAQNKGSLTTGVSLAKANANFNVFKSVISSSFDAMATGVNVGVPSSAIGYGKNATTTGLNYMQELWNIEDNIKIQKENALYSPDTIKMGNNFSTDMFLSAIEPITATYKVGDYNDIENERKRIGFLSHDITYGGDIISNIGVELDHKYLMIGDCEPTLTNYYSREFIANIKERFKNGIRFYTYMTQLGE